MSYVNPNYKTKKEFVEAVKAGRKHETFNPSGIGTTQNGNDVVEGPHFPQPHRWYASVVVQNGIVIKAKHNKKVNHMTVAELDIALQKCQTTMGGVQSKYVRNIMEEKVTRIRPDNSEYAKKLRELYD